MGFWNTDVMSAVAAANPQSVEVDEPGTNKPPCSTMREQSAWLRRGKTRGLGVPLESPARRHEIHLPVSSSLLCVCCASARRSHDLPTHSAVPLARAQSGVAEANVGGERRHCFAFGRHEPRAPQPR